MTGQLIRKISIFCAGAMKRSARGSSTDDDMFEEESIKNEISVEKTAAQKHGALSKQNVASPSMSQQSKEELYVAYYGMQNVGATKRVRDLFLCAIINQSYTLALKFNTSPS